MTNKRGHGEGTIQERGENTYRLRYRVDGGRFLRTFHGSDGGSTQGIAENSSSPVTTASTSIRRKRRSGQWIEEWLAAGRAWA